MCWMQRKSVKGKHTTNRSRKQTKRKLLRILAVGFVWPFFTSLSLSHTRWIVFFALSFLLLLSKSFRVIFFFIGFLLIGSFVLFVVKRHVIYVVLFVASKQNETVEKKDDIQKNEKRENITNTKKAIKICGDFFFALHSDHDTPRIFIWSFCRSKLIGRFSACVLFSRFASSFLHSISLSLSSSAMLCRSMFISVSSQISA